VNYKGREEILNSLGTRHQCTKTKVLTVLGTQTSNVQSLDKRYLVDESKFNKKAENMRQS